MICLDKKATLHPEDLQRFSYLILYRQIRIIGYSSKYLNIQFLTLLFRHFERYVPIHDPPAAGKTHSYRTNEPQKPSHNLDKRNSQAQAQASASHNDTRPNERTSIAEKQ